MGSALLFRIRSRQICVLLSIEKTEIMPREILHPFNRGSLQTGVRFISTTSHITAVIIDKTQTSDPSDSLYIYIYIYRMNILHIGTLNSKLLHFGQELQFDGGGSFDELINRGPFGFMTSCFLRIGESLHFIAYTFPF